MKIISFMGVYSVCQVPMSSNCIELSSDEDEVQFIPQTFQPKTSLNNSAVSSRKSSCNAVERLARNSSIELTINLDASGTVKKSNGNESALGNGIIQLNHDFNNTTQVEKLSNGNKSDSDIEIIEDDAPAIPQKSTVNSPASNVSRPASKPERHKSVAQNASNNIRKSAAPGEPARKSSSGQVYRHCSPQVPSSAVQQARQSFSQMVASSFSSFNTEAPSTSVKQQSRHSLPQMSTSSFSNQNIMTTLQKPLQVKKIDEDIICIDDDEDDDDEENSHPSKSDKTDVKSEDPADIRNSTASPEKELSYTEQLVNALREKINQKNGKENVKKDKSTNNVNTNKLGKRRVNPDTVICADPSTIPDSQFRVTRSSLLPQQNRGKVDEARQSSSRSKSNGLSAMNEPMNKYSVENMFRGLVKICKKIFTDEALETKLWRTFRQASDEVLISEEFINALKLALKVSEESKIESLDDKLMVSREIKEVMRLMKRHPEVVNRKVKRLTKMLNIIRGRIRKLEEAEVTSDEEEENPYILLDRYRARAAKIYDKLCELQGTPADAGRVAKQKLKFNGSTGHPKIEMALEKFYHKTKSFPDFFDVRTLVEKTVKKDNIDIPPQSIHNIAQTLFVQFGTKLKRMRLFDEYTILNDYLDEETMKDPALDNEELYRNLANYDSSKKIREGELKILDEFACKQMEQKNKEGAKTEESDANDGSEDETVVENEGKKEELRFSDTEEELMTTEVNDNKRKLSSSDEEDNEDDTTRSRKKPDLTVDESASPCKIKIASSISLNGPDLPS